jgi:hypothetical protein
MSEGRGNFKGIIIGFMVFFLLGGAAGYYIFGRNHKPPDYKDMLRQTISYITALEEKNQEIAKEMSALQNDMANLQKQQDEPGNDQLTRLNERVAVLEKENADLKARTSQSEALAQENQQLRQKVQNLVESMNSPGYPPKASENVPVQAH